jgi:hypothetical protein
MPHPQDSLSETELLYLLNILQLARPINPPNKCHIHYPYYRIRMRNIELCRDNPAIL